MLKCSIEDLRYVQSKNITLHCITPFTSSNGGEYGHMLEMFMVVDFPNGHSKYKNKFIFLTLLTTMSILAVIS